MSSIFVFFAKKENLKFTVSSGSLPLHVFRSADSSLLRYFYKSIDIGFFILIKAFVLIGVEFFCGDRSSVPVFTLEVSPELLSGEDPPSSGVDFIQGKEDFPIGQSVKRLLGIVTDIALRQDEISGKYFLFFLQRFFAGGFFFLFLSSFLCFFLSFPGRLFLSLPLSFRSFSLSGRFFFRSRSCFLFLLLLFGFLFSQPGFFLRCLLFLLSQLRSPVNRLRSAAGEDPAVEQDKDERDQGNDDTSFGI